MNTKQVGFKAKMQTKVVLSSSLLIILMNSWGSLAAQEQEPLLIDVSSCVILESILERYECYEKQVELGESGSASQFQNLPVSQPAIVSRPVAEAPQSSQPAQTERVTEDNFGLPDDPVEELGNVEELISKISELREFRPNYFSITLENGQVWRQTVGKRYRLRVGHQVRIYPTSWGSSYRLAVDSLGSYIQVERVE